MLALVASPALPRLTIPQSKADRQQQTGWIPAPPAQPRGLPRELPRRLSTAGRTVSAASSAVSDLATYHFVQRHAGTASEWFQCAVREIVKHVDEAPMLQTVQLGAGGAAAKCATYSVHDSVVAVPQLWQSIAQHVSQQSPDVIILVQRVSPSDAGGSPQGAMDAAAAAQRQQQGSSSPPGSPRVQAEEACRRLVSSGVADAILLHGQVGDCCDGSEPLPTSSSTSPRHQGHSVQQQAPRSPPLPSIVPFTPSGGGSSRRDVRVAAISPAGSGSGSGSGPASNCGQGACYWGLVVQSRQHTGAEGCYLLKTVKSASGTGCSCTHFSLTRISHGDHLEQQFVQSWLV